MICMSSVCCVFTCASVCMTEVKRPGVESGRGWGVIIHRLSPSDESRRRWHHPTKMQASDRTEYSYLSK